MSYCRWSSNKSTCDLYCYEDVSGGYTTHVAGMRRIGAEDVPDIPDMMSIDASDKAAVAEWARAYREQGKLISELPLAPIGLSEDGNTFNDPDLPSFLERVRWLRGLGYNVPEFVDEKILEEMEDDSACGT